MHKGKFIVFEGLDGSGSSTHTAKLNEYLRFKGIKSAVTKEPTNNVIGGTIRGVLTKEWRLSSYGLQLLFAADRAHHIGRFIKPNLNKSINVICDRYMYSTIAFGSCELDDVKWLAEINKYFLVPDLVILLKVSPKECMKRINKGRAETELFEEETKLNKVWETYEKLAKENNNFIIVNGERPKEIVFEEIKSIVDKLL